jgi:hypothetical protein
LGALVSMCRSLCFTTARVVWALDADLTNREAADLSDESFRETALEVLGCYARSAAGR